VGSASFEAWLIRRGIKETTLIRHLKNLTVLNRELPDWSEESIDNFIVNLRRSGRLGATINCYIDTIRCYSQYTDNSLYLKHYKYFKREASVKVTFSDNDVEKFIKVSLGERDDLFWKLVIFTGARLGEIGRLTVSSINFQTNVIIIEGGKTGFRTIPIPPNLKQELSDYIQKVKDHLFITNKGRVYSDSVWQHTFKKRLKLAGIPERPHLTPYSFRHTFITSCLSEDISPFKIAKQCGNSVQVIGENYEHLVVKDLEKMLNKHPIIRKQTNPHAIIDLLDDFLKSLNLENDERFEFEVCRANSEIKISLRAK
jgi:integrase